jgi:hypothetical protein
MLRTWLGRFSRTARPRSIRRFGALETLEARTLLTVDLLSGADPSLFGATSNGDSGIPSMSDSGNITAFQSSGSNLVNGVPASKEIYAYNQTNDSLTLVTPKFDGSGPSGQGGFNPVVSPDGRYVLFFSPASDLISPRTGLNLGVDQLYLRDLQTNTTTLISVAPDGTTIGNSDSGGDSNQGNGGVSPSLYEFSGDGHHVVFWSAATNLVGQGPATANQLYVRDLQIGKTELVSAGANGNPAGNATDFDRISFRSLSISNDGRYVSFSTTVNGLVSGDTNGVEDIYVRDTVNHTTQLVSVAAGTTAPGSGASKNAAMSDDGKLIYFVSTSSNLITGTTIDDQQLYVRDMQSGVTSLVSHALGLPTVGSDNGVDTLSISKSGRFVAFASVSSNLTSDAADSGQDIFLYDQSLQTITLVTPSVAGTGEDGFSFTPIISGDGATIVFGNDGTDLVSNFVDNNSFYPDYYVYHRSTGGVELLTAAFANPTHGGTSNENILFSRQYAVLSSDGSSVAFQNLSDNLVSDDHNRSLDVFLHTASGTKVISRRDPSLSEGFAAGGAFLGSSEDGRYVLLSSFGPIINGTEARLFVRDTVTGDVQPIFGLLGSVNPIFSTAITSDGRYVVFTDGSVVQLYDRQNDTTEVISQTPGHVNSTGFFNNVAISDNARYVAFSGNASDLVPNFVDGNGGGADVYLRDRQTGQTVLVNRKQGTATTSSNVGLAQSLQISADGHRVFFDTRASDLTANDNSGPVISDIYFFDVLNATVGLASVNSSGTAAGIRSGYTISDDGRYLAFISSGTNVVPGVSDGFGHVYVRDLQTGVNQLVDVSSSGGAAGVSDSAPEITPDGRFVIFQSTSSHLVAGAGDDLTANVYVRDLSTGQTRLVSVSTDGTSGGNQPSVLDLDGRRQISPNGRFVLFESNSSNLVDDFVDGNGSRADLYLRDLQTGQTVLVTRSFTSTGSANDGTSVQTSGQAFVLNNGRVLFESSASDLTPIFDSNRIADVFLADPFALSGGTIQGVVYEDLNGNGQQDAGEHGIFNAAVYLDADNDAVHDASETAVRTGVDGSYSFVGVPLGTLHVRQDFGADTQLSQPATGSYTVSLATNGQTVSDQDFGDKTLRPDLTVGNLSVVSSGNGSPLRNVSWTVTNSGDFATLTGAWQDAVYLSRTPLLSSGAILLATVPHVGNLNVGGSYQSQVTVDPNGAADPSIPYYIIVQTDRQSAVSESHEDNNLSAPGPLTLDIPVLTVGTPATTTFTSAVQARYYQINLGPEDVVHLALRGNTSGAADELYVGEGTVPTRAEFDFSATAPSQQNQDLVLQAGELGETFYVLLYSSVLPTGTNASVTLTASPSSLAVDSIDQTTADRGGTITLRVRGDGFSRGVMNLQLADNAGHSVSASKVDFISTTEVYATFDLSAVPAGVYDLMIQEQYEQVILSDELDSLITQIPMTKTVSLNHALTVTASHPDNVQTSLDLPSSVRLGKPFYFTVTYTNNGTHDVVSPVLKIVTNDGVILTSANQLETGTPGTLTVLALPSEGPGTVIRPGQSVVLNVAGTSPVDILLVNVDVYAIRDDGSPVDYSAFLDSLGVFTPGEKATALAALQTRYGTTWTSYVQNLRDQATDLASLGTPSNSTLKLLLNTLLTGNTSSDVAAPNVIIPNSPVGSGANAEVADAEDLAVTPTDVTAGTSDTSTGTSTWDDEFQALDEISALASSPESLAACYFALSELAVAETAAGAFTASLNLTHFLQNSGEPLIYDRKSFPALQARQDAFGKVFFKGEEAKAIDQATKIIEGRIRADDLDTTPFAVDVKPLDFYLSGFNGSQVLFLPSGSFNLQIAFGGMRRAQATVTDINYQVVNDDDGDCHVVYTAKIEYVFEDDYVFDQDDVNKSLYAQCAFALQEAGLAKEFVTQIQLDSKMGGSVQLMNDPNCIPIPPEPPQGQLLASGQIRILTAHDPNDIVGPGGYGPQQFFVPQSEAALPYVIHFENDPEQATAPAQEVTVTQQLDADLDWTTFQFGQLGFGSTVVDVEPGKQAFDQQVTAENQDGSPLLVDVSGSLNLQTGVITWTFRSVDPETGLLPQGVLDGFLPVNDATGRGEGSITYSISPKSNLTTGTTINASASIVFDTNTPVLTNVFMNTVDRTPPVSNVTALPATTGTATFNVAWSGSDSNGSGIATYDIYVSDNGGQFILFLDDTTVTTATYVGQNHHTYAFYAVATDNVGLVESDSHTAEASTTVNEVPHLDVNGPAVTWIKGQPPATVLPAIRVANANLAGNTLTINASAVSTKKKRLDLYSIPSASAIGTVVQSDTGTGNIHLEILLNGNVTDSAVQSFLRGIKFSTKGKGLSTATRTLTVILGAEGETPATASQTIQVKKKADKPPRR